MCDLDRFSKSQSHIEFQNHLIRMPIFTRLQYTEYTATYISKISIAQLVNRSTDRATFTTSLLHCLSTLWNMLEATVHISGHVMLWSMSWCTMSCLMKASVAFFNCSMFTRWWHKRYYDIGLHLSVTSYLMSYTGVCMYVPTKHIDVHISKIFNKPS